MATDATRVIDNLSPLYWVGLLWHSKTPGWGVLGEANYIILKKEVARNLWLDCAEGGDETEFKKTL